MGDARRQSYVFAVFLSHLVRAIFRRFTPRIYFYDSFVLGIPLPGHARVRGEAHGLPVSKRGGHQVRCA